MIVSAAVATTLSTIIISSVSILSAAYITTSIVNSEAAKETAKTNAEAQKYAADAAKTAQVESAKERSKADMFETKTREKELHAQLNHEVWEYNQDSARHSEIDNYYAYLDSNIFGEGRSVDQVDFDQPYDYGFDLECQKKAPLETV